jgi:hypothetical protein
MDLQAFDGCCDGGSFGLEALGFSSHRACEFICVEFCVKYGLLYEL